MRLRATPVPLAAAVSPRRLGPAPGTPTAHVAASGSAAVREVNALVCSWVRATRRLPAG